MSGCLDSMIELGFRCDDDCFLDSPALVACARISRQLISRNLTS